MVKSLFLCKKFFKKLLGFIQSNLPVIISLKEPIEGGKIKIIEKERLKNIKVLFEAQPEPALSLLKSG